MRNPHVRLDPLSEQVLADDYERRDRSHEADLDRDRYWVEGFYCPELSKRMDELKREREKAA